jgi:phage terminase large subunit-like protein
LATLKFSTWRQQARPDQLPPSGEWRIAYYRGGRGSGKTWVGAHILAEWILADADPGEWGIVAPTYEDGWATCVEGPSGILAALGTTALDVKLGRSPLVRYWNRSASELRFTSGHLIRVASADSGGLRIQGKNLKGAWADEVGLWENWETAWSESLGYAVRMGNARIVATGTPKATRKARVLIKQLLEDPQVVKRRLRTIDNAANLAKAFLDDVVGRAKGTRLERQELEGELIEDVEGALWTVELIDAGRVTHAEVPPLTRIVVAVDPAVTSNDKSDETGIIIVGEYQGHGYVLADYSIKGTPNACMKRAVQAYRDFNADRIIAEVNNGGDYIGSLLRTVDPNVPYQVVTASRGKQIRAEPCAALYEQTRIHHVGPLTDLEDQMISWIPDKSGESPDRVDALVWATAALRSLSVGSWSDAYGVSKCTHCDEPYMVALHPEKCPHCKQLHEQE